MSLPYLAARDVGASPKDPFATPNLNPKELISPPAPAAQRHDSRHWPPYDAQNGHAVYPHKSASLSSTGTSSIATHHSSAYLEKGGQSVSCSAQGKQTQATRDPEKADRPRRDHQDKSRRGVPINDDNDDEGDEAAALQERKAVNILLFLCGPCVLLSFLNALWTLVSLFVTSLTQPVRLCARRPGFGQQLGGLLGPALNLQLRSIYTPLPPYANEDFSYHTAMLVLIQLLSPFASIGMMVAAWVVAVFWILTMVVGDPVGTDKRDDGKETVLAIRKWWESWLVRSINLE